MKSVSHKLAVTLSKRRKLNKYVLDDFENYKVRFLKVVRDSINNFIIWLKIWDLLQMFWWCWFMFSGTYNLINWQNHWLFFLSFLFFFAFFFLFFYLRSIINIMFPTSMQKVRFISWITGHGSFVNILLKDLCIFLLPFGKSKASLKSELVAGQANYSNIA